MARRATDEEAACRCGYAQRRARFKNPASPTDAKALSSGQMHTPTLYLDTSVLGGFFDDEWQQSTRELWRQMESGLWRFVTSAVTTEELLEAPKRVLHLFDTSFDMAGVFNITREMETLAAAYVDQGIVTAKYANDARHVAACTVICADYLVSWNFRHLVNVQRQGAFNRINLLHGHPAVNIVNPLELIYGCET